MRNLRRVSVFGGREITQDIYDETVILGKMLAKEGYTIFCGGGRGVMEANATSQLYAKIAFRAIPISVNIGMEINSLASSRFRPFKIPITRPFPFFAPFDIASIHPCLLHKR